MMMRIGRDCSGDLQPRPNGHPAKPRGPAHSLYDVCSALRDKLDAFLAQDATTPLLRSAQARLRVSMDIAEQALRRYSLDQIAISWNGGKDCLVLLVILLASIPRCFPGPSSNGDRPDEAAALPEKLHSMYIVSAHPFPEVDAFVASSSAEYHLDTVRFILPMKEGLAAFLREKPSVQSIFIGTRRTDPHGEKLQYFDPTDSGWPSVMRVHPILEWRLAEIWTFIRYLEIPYCSLYDRGYTSLGGVLDTRPNPRLKKGDEGFLPAYELIEDDEERLGRNR